MNDEDELFGERHEAEERERQLYEKHMELVKKILKEYVKWRDTTEIDLGAYIETEQLELYLDQLNKKAGIRKNQSLICDRCNEHEKEEISDPYCMECKIEIESQDN